MHIRELENATKATRAKFHLEALAPGTFSLDSGSENDGVWTGTFLQDWTDKEAHVAVFLHHVCIVWGEHTVTIDTSDIDVGGREPVNYYIARREYEKLNAKNPELRYLYAEYAP